jgi:hypothetical protein
VRKALNFLVRLLRSTTPVIGRPPVTKASLKPKPPRRPTFNFVQNVVPDEIHSIIRTTWFKNGRAIEVDQLFLMEDEQATEIFQYLVGGALRQGCDVTVMTTYSPEALGVPRE